MLAIGGILLATAIVGPQQRTTRWLLGLSVGTSIVLTVRGLWWVTTIEGADFSDIGRGLLAACLASILGLVAAVLVWRAYSSNEPT